MVFPQTRQRMDILMMAAGSHGDVLPILGLGRILQARGHSVRVVANPVFGAAAESAGVALVAAGSREDYWRKTQDAGNTRVWTAFRSLSRVAVRELGVRLETARSQLRDRPTLLVGSTLSFSLRCLSELYGLPLVQVHYQPSTLRSVSQPPVWFGRLPAPDWVPRAWIRAGYWMLDHFWLDPPLCWPFNRFRQSLGLPPISRMMGPWLHRVDLNLALFPPWFAGAPDWPQPLTQCHFPLWDEEGSFPEELQRFLDDGPAPVVFASGTPHGKRSAFFGAALGACRRLGLRGVFLSRFESPQVGLDPTILVCRYAALSRLAPRAAALVHPGGIGTTAAAMVAGIPQVIQPLAHDQFDNAYRARLLGVNCGPSLAQGLERALGDGRVRERARQIATFPGWQGGLEEAAAQLERVSPRTPCFKR